MGLMTFGTVLVLGDCLTSPAIAQVGSDPGSFMKDLHRGWSGADFHELLHQGVGHAVKVSIEGNVVIDVDGGPHPLTHIEALGR
jgi:hypothetical protein